MLIRFRVICFWLYQSAVMADVVTVKTIKIDALLTKMWSFQGYLASYFRIMKVLIIYRRNEISSPISFNQEFGQPFAKKKLAPYNSLQWPLTTLNYAFPWRFIKVKLVSSFHRFLQNLKAHWAQNSFWRFSGNTHFFENLKRRRAGWVFGKSVKPVL